jgi:hypothetical protein
VALIRSLETLHLAGGQKTAGRIWLGVGLGEWQGPMRTARQGGEARSEKFGSGLGHHEYLSDGDCGLCKMAGYAQYRVGADCKDIPTQSWRGRATGYVGGKYHYVGWLMPS